MDWEAQITHHDVSSWGECNDIVFNFVAGAGCEKTTRGPGGALHVGGVTARHLRLYALVNGCRAARYTESTMSHDAEAMWEAAVSDASFLARTLPEPRHAVFHRVDCGRRSEAANKETTTRQFTIAVNNWYSRYGHVLAASCMTPAHPHAPLYRPPPNLSHRGCP